MGQQWMIQSNYQNIRGDKEVHLLDFQSFVFKLITEDLKIESLYFA